MNHSSPFVLSYRFSVVVIVIGLLTLAKGQADTDSKNVTNFIRSEKKIGEETLKTNEVQNNNIIEGEAPTFTNKSRKYKDFFNLGREILITDNRIPESWADEVGNWEPPYEIAKAYPYYVSGFDSKNQPIWISEWGKFDMRLLFRGDAKKKKAAFEKYTKQAAYLAVLSHEIRSTPENPVKQHAFIIDFDGLTLAQLGNRQIVSFCVDLARRYRTFFEKNIAKMVLINVNSVAEILINLARHIFGRILGRVESYGTDKTQWGPALLRLFPKDQLPEWYSGSKNHTPVYVFG